MSRRGEACRPVAVIALILLPAAWILLSLVGIVLMFVFLDLGEFWWFLPPVILGDVMMVYLAWLAPRRLGYRPGRKRLTITTFAGQREVTKGEIASARLIDYRLGRKTLASELPGYYVGRFRGSLGEVRAFVGRKNGRGVLLELKNGEKILINPRDPERCLKPLELDLEEET